jgi:hypothetical protein
MNKQEIATTLREEIGHLEVSIKKVQDRCERLKKFVLSLEEEISPSPPPQKTIFDTKFGKVIEKVFGEEPKRPKRWPGTKTAAEDLPDFSCSRFCIGKRRAICQSPRCTKRAGSAFDGFDIRSGTTTNSFRPITYRIEATRQRVFTHVTGAISAVDIVGHFEVARREGFLPYAEMLDASSIVDPTLSLVESGKAALAVRNLGLEQTFGSRAVSGFLAEGRRSSPRLHRPFGHGNLFAPGGSRFWWAHEGRNHRRGTEARL